VPSADSLASIFAKAVSVDHVSSKNFRRKWTKDTLTTRILLSEMITSNNQPEAAATLPQLCKCREHARLPTAEGIRRRGMQESSGTVSYYSRLQHLTTAFNSCCWSARSHNFWQTADVLRCWDASFWHLIIQQWWHRTQQLWQAATEWWWLVTQGRGVGGSYGTGACWCCHAVTTTENWHQQD